MQANVNGGYSYSNNQSASLIQQSGLIHQDLKNSNNSNSTSPSLNGNVSLSKKSKNLKNIFSLNTSFSLNSSSSSQQISTNTLYYNKSTGALLKDSLLNRDLDGKTNSRTFNFGFSFIVGLKKPRDTLARQNLNFNYNGSTSSSTNNTNTFAFNNISNKASFIDSLSTSFNSISFNQSFGSNYSYASDKMWYNLGFNANINMLNNHDFRLQQTIGNNAFNYSPSLNFSRLLAFGKTLSIYYQGNNRNPTINQLQPVRNALNLQNILVGNPDLKASFSHSLSIGFNYAGKSGRSLQMGVTASTTQNEIVSNVILLPDTLNSLKQITRYENINGNYQVGSNYQFFLPAKQNKYSLSYSGQLGFSNHVVLFNNQRTSGKGFNFSQQLSGNLSLKTFTLNTHLSCSITNNNNSGLVNQYQPIGIGQISASTFFRTINFTANVQSNLRLEKLKLNASVAYSTNHNDADANQVVRDNSDISMNFSGLLTILKSYFTNFSISKRISYGYTLANPNPLLVNADVGKRFLKDKSLNINIRVTDLLGQGNNILRSISGNTIIDSRSLQPTRVFSINLNYNLSNFGGKNIRVNTME